MRCSWDSSLEAVVQMPRCQRGSFRGNILAKNKLLFLAFKDSKVFDRVLCSLIWWSLKETRIANGLLRMYKLCGRMQQVK